MEKNLKFLDLVKALTSIPSGLLSKKEMETLAKKHYGGSVVCDPGFILLGDGCSAIVWRCRSYSQGLPVLGYFFFGEGFKDFPSDFKEGVKAFCVFSHVTSEVCGVKVWYSDAKLQFR